MTYEEKDFLKRELLAQQCFLLALKGIDPTNPLSDKQLVAAAYAFQTTRTIADRFGISMPSPEEIMKEAVEVAALEKLYGESTDS